MQVNDTYNPIDCDDYDNLELACQHHLALNIKLRGGDSIQGVACDLFTRKNVEYLVLKVDNQSHELRLDHIYSFSHPEIGTIVIRYDE